MLDQTDLPGDEHTSEAEEVPRQDKGNKKSKEQQKPKEEEAKADPELERKVRLGINIQMAMQKAYPKPVNDADADRITKIAMNRSKEVMSIISKEKIDVNVPLLEMVNIIQTVLSIKSEHIFVLSRATINAIKKSMKKSDGYKDVEFQQIEEFPWIENEMIKAAGGKEEFDSIVAKYIGQALLGLNPGQIREAFRQLEKTEKVIHDVQNAHNNPNPEKKDNVEVKSDQAEDLIEILELQEFTALDVAEKPLGVNDILMLMDTDKKWLSMSENEKAQVIYNMTRIAQHFKLNLVTGPRGPELVS